MAKFSQPIKADPRAHEEEEGAQALPAFLFNVQLEENSVPAPKAQEEPEDEDTEGLPPRSEFDAPEKHKRDYEVIDADVLYRFNPNLFKLTPNFKKITQAIKLGFELPGVKMRDAGEEVSKDKMCTDPLLRRL